MNNLVPFAGASDGKKSVVIYHDVDLKYPPSCVIDWSEVASYWLKHSSFGEYFLQGELKADWVIVEVKKVS
jgi:hypothetical protein